MLVITVLLQRTQTRASWMERPWDGVPPRAVGACYPLPVCVCLPPGASGFHGAFPPWA